MDGAGTRTGAGRRILIRRPAAPSRHFSRGAECPACQWDAEGDFAHTGEGYCVHYRPCGRRSCGVPLLTIYHEQGGEAPVRVLGTALVPVDEAAPNPIGEALLRFDLPEAVRMRLHLRIVSLAAVRRSRAPRIAGSR